MKSYNQIASVELTTDQVLLSIAIITTSLRELTVYLEENADDENLELDELRETKTDLSKLLQVFDNARLNIEEYWRH